LKSRGYAEVIRVWRKGQYAEKGFVGEPPINQISPTPAKCKNLVSPNSMFTSCREISKAENTSPSHGYKKAIARTSIRHI